MESEVAVGVLFYNKFAQTAACLNSIIETAPQVRIYILNNNSDQDQRKQLGDFVQTRPQIQIIDAESNLGISKGRNRIVEIATEPWLLFIDNDITIKTAKWLENLKLHISYSKQVEVFIPRLFNVHEGVYSREVNCEILVDNTVAFHTSISQYSNVFPGGAAIIARALFERLGPYDEGIFVGFEDFELAIRAIKNNKPIVSMYIPDIELIHKHEYSANQADQAAVKVRYRSDHIDNSHDLILNKHGVILDSNYKPWLDEQIRQLTIKPIKPTLVAKLLAKITRIFA